MSSREIELEDGRAAALAARRLQALADDLVRLPARGGSVETIVAAFRAAARALESAGDPPSQRQVLALVQVLAAGFEKLAAEPSQHGCQANDVERANGESSPLTVPRGAPAGRLRITLWSGSGR